MAPLMHQIHSVFTRSKNFSFVIHFDIVPNARKPRALVVFCCFFLLPFISCCCCHFSSFFYLENWNKDRRRICIVLIETVTPNKTEWMRVYHHFSVGIRVWMHFFCLFWHLVVSALEFRRCIWLYTETCYLNEWLAGCGCITLSLSLFLLLSKNGGENVCLYRSTSSSAFV